MDRTGSASRYEISSSGSHTVKGNATVNGDLNVVKNGTSTNILTALDNKQNLVNPSVDIPNWLQLQADYFYYFSDPVAPILRLKTDNIAPKANPAFTGNANIQGNLTIGGTFQIGETFQISPNAGIPQAMVNGLTDALNAKQDALTFASYPDAFSLRNGSTVRGLAPLSPIFFSFDHNDNVIQIGLNQSASGSNYFNHLYTNMISGNGAPGITLNDLVDITGALSVDAIKARTADQITVNDNVAINGNVAITGNLDVSGTSILCDTIKALAAEQMIIDDNVGITGNVGINGNVDIAGNLNVSGAFIACDTIKASVANEMTIDDDVAINGALLVDTIRSSVASQLTLDDNVQINQDLVCSGTLRLGSASSAGRVVIAGGPQNFPNEETALKLIGNNSSIKVEMENLGGGKTTK